MQKYGPPYTRRMLSNAYWRELWADVYRKIDPTSIQEGRSHIYTGSTTTVYRESRSRIYTKRAKLGFKRSDNWLIFHDNNGSMPPVMATGKNYWSEMLFSDSWYWWFSFEVWGPFLLRRKRPQWSLLTASHWTNTALPNLLLIQWMGVRGVLLFFLSKPS